MKPGETAGTGGDENMKRGGHSVSHTSDFGHGYMNHETHCHIIIASHWPTTEHRSTTNLIKSAKLTIIDPGPTLNTFG